jgi:acyl-coenzyme A synthetase/AMP-(fatty) acid ligase
MVDFFPMTPSGKVQKFKLRELLAREANDDAANHL